MLRSIKIYGLLGVFICIYFFAFFQLKETRLNYLEHNYMDYTLPSKFTGPVALEFKGLASDYLLFKFMAFLGGRVQDMAENEKKYREYTYQTLDTITDLDPYYWDAYLFSEMFLAWGGYPQGANRILKKAMKHLPNDYRPPYYVGFNYHYFLKDNKSASQYLMHASKLPGCPYYVAALAARLSVYSFQHKDGIIFLKQMLENTNDKRAKREFQLRISTMKILDQLENLITEYHNEYKKYPEHLDKLVEAGLIDRIPEDPYGGEFVIIGGGRVYTTSKMLAYPAKK